MIVIGAWVFYPYSTIEIVNANAIKVDKPVYHTGDTIIYTMSYCKENPQVMNVMRALVNGTRVTYASILSDPPIGCHTNTFTSLAIPSLIEPGIYHMETTLEFKVNPIRTIYKYWKTQEFTIVK